MSTLSRPSPDAGDASGDAGDSGGIADTVRELLHDHPPASSARGAVQATAFWSAVALPFLHLPLALSGFSSTPEAMVFFGLLGLNVLALAIGHGHRQS